MLVSNTVASFDEFHAITRNAEVVAAAAIREAVAARVSPAQPLATV
ncbi:hypothetical protein [Methylobacterium oryzisoli]